SCSPLFSESPSHTLRANPSEESQPTTHSRPIAEPKTDWGIQFTCSPTEITQLKKDFEKLFTEYGWVAPKNLIENHLSADGTRLRFKLNTPLEDTDTFSLNRRPEFQIKDDEDHFTDRAGAPAKYLVASEKEIVAAMLQNGRLSEFDKTHCSFDKFKEHIQIRKNIIRWGVRAMWKFPENGPVMINPQMWADGWELKKGVKSTDAIADAFTGKFNYEIGCTKACQLIMAQGILDYFKNVKKDPKTSEHLDHITSQSPLDTMEMSVQGESKKEMLKEGTLVDRHFNVPYNNWIPGDWGWIKNPDAESAAEYGYEGCNIVYIGRGLFVVYYDKDPDRTLDEALIRVYRWREDKKEKAITPELVSELRKDPRAGGLMRDVRDFPKNFPAGLDKNPR
ncbi:MAG: hypothetical protein ACKOA8_14340, partial [Deltaproteobacteria bacterium]